MPDLYRELCRCDGGVDRRSFLRFLVAGSAAMALSHGGPGLVRAAAKATGPAKSVILLWMAGGPSQIETFDPKPDSKNGGELGAIPTSAKSFQISGALPRIAAQAHLLTVVRTLTSGEASHDRATHLLHTGQEPISGLEFAPAGTVVAREKGDAEHPLPRFIAITPPPIPLARAFGDDCLPFSIEDVNRPVPDLESRVEPLRDSGRNALLESANRSFAKGRDAPLLERLRASARRAHDLMTTPLKAAFDLKQASEAERKEYGPGFGQKCLLARRLVQAGVPFVEVGLSGWDHHVNVGPNVKRLAGQLDQGMAALLADLDRTGLLDETLVVWMGEFGRTPELNPQKGRDHFTRCFSAVLAGGPVPRGHAIGQTDRDGMDVVKRPVSVPDLFTTIYEALGIDPNVEYTTEARPIAYGAGGRSLLST